MKKILGIFVLAIVSCPLAWADCPDYLNTEVKALHSNEKISLCENFGNKPMLIVNTASHCGYTPQFKGIEAVHQQYKDKGLVVLGFSSNSFRQEAKSEAKAAEVCYVNYGVTFQMFAEVNVKGKKAHPIFKGLAQQSEAPSWNFNKYLINKDGAVVERFGSSTKPESKEFISRIEELI